jgi:hypothetical protein
MRERRHLWTVLVAVLLAGLGFAVGAVGAAWRQRDLRADPWRKMRVEHEGTERMTTRTRLVFENPALALQAVEVTRSPEAVPELARVVLRDGRELTVRYDKEARPSALEAPDGSRAAIGYEGDKARVDFFAPDRKELGTKAVTVPVQLRSLLNGARAELDAAPIAPPWEDWLELVVRRAWAQDADERVSVVRHLELRLDVRTPGTTDGAGIAQVEASCAPLSCVPVTSELPMPGQTTVRVAVSGSVKRSELQPADPAAVEPFRKTATAERSSAARVLPDVASVVAAVGVTAMACKSLKLAGSVCVTELAKSSTAGAAIHAVSSYDVPTKGRIVDQRAEQLYYVEQARAVLDREAAVQVCVAREKYIRACTEVKGRPLAAEPMAPVERALDMRRGIGGTLVGSFALTQQDGPDCKFSPSPKTNGTLRLTFDNERNSVTAALRAEQRGTRPDLRCSLGTANMAWSQTYSATLTQTFTAKELQAGGKLPLRLTGTMNGTGSYSFSNCRTSGGASANCPAGKGDGYSYPMELVGELDLATQTGSGRLVVTNAPMATGGTWRIPAGEAP